MHRILRQTVDITTGSHTRAFGMQDSLARALRGPGSDALERALDRACGDRILRVERLELDLGRIRGPGWLDAFMERLAEAAERILEAGAAEPATPEAPSARGPAANGGPQGVGAPDLRTDRFGRIAAFLSSGRLPWWAPDAAQPGWFAADFAQLDTGDRQRLIALVACAPTALTRLLIQLPPGTVAELVAESAPPELHSCLPEACREIETMLGLLPVPLWAWRTGFWQPLFERADSGWETDAAPAIVRAWLACLVRIAPAAPNVLRQRRPAVASSLPKAWQRALARALEAGAPAKRKRAERAGRSADPEAARTLEEKAPDAPVASGAAAAGLAPNIASSKTAAPADLERPGMRDDDAIAVSGAGIVLFHPFLAELFGRLTLVEERQFSSREAPHRAVRILGYLGFGTDQAEEADLVLAKVLCGIEPEAVLLPAELDDAEIAAAGALMAAVMEHWAALRTGSEDWLRAQFLMRDGTLQRTHGGWRLVVEARAQDVLLSRLPWGIGVIELPWMTGMLHVRWRD